jgi:hypothetical protein
MEQLKVFYDETYAKPVEYQSIINIIARERLIHPDAVNKARGGNIVKFRGETKKRVPVNIYRIQKKYNITPEFVEMVKTDILPYYTT